MAGIQIDGVNNKIDFDDDADTSISSATDDTLVFEVAGATDFTITANTFTAESGSTITTPTLGVGNTKDLGAGIHIKTADSGASANAAADDLVIEQGSSGNGAGLSILSATDDTGNIFFGDSGDNDVAFIQYNHSSNIMVFEAGAGGEAMRITNGGVTIGGNAEDDATILTVKGGGDQTMISAQSSKSDYGGYVIRADAERGATVSYGLFDALSGNLGDREFYVRGDGNVFADGSFSGSGADYAEFFETNTGSAISIGTTVVLENNKVRASTDSDAAAAIIGVVRPKSDIMMKASMVIGNCAWNHWSQKY